MAVKRVTVREVAQAMVDDKTRKLKKLFEQERVTLVQPISFLPFKFQRRVKSSCAIGGAALKLGLNANSLANALMEVNRGGVPVPNAAPDALTVEPSLINAIFIHNDATNASKAQIGHLILTNADQQTLNTMLEVEERMSGYWHNKR